MGMLSVLNAERMGGKVLDNKKSFDEELRKLIDNFRIVEWTLAHDSNDADESIRYRATLLTSKIKKLIRDRRPEYGDCTNCPFNMGGNCGKWHKKICRNPAIRYWSKALGLGE